MSTHGETFLYNLPTLETFLRCEARIDSYHLVTGSLSLILKDGEKRAPTGVTDGFGKGMVLDHPTDMKVFNHDMVIVIGVLLSRLEVKITALTCDLEMGLSSISGSLTASVTALLAAANLALFASEGFLRGAIVAWVLDRVPFGVSQEHLQAHINPDVRMITGTWKVLRLGLRFADDESVPMSVGTQYQMSSLGRALYRAVKFDLEHLPKFGRHLQMFAIRGKPHITRVLFIAILPQLDGMPAVGLETIVSTLHQGWYSAWRQETV